MSSPSPVGASSPREGDKWPEAKMEAKLALPNGEDERRRRTEESSPAGPSQQPHIVNGHHHDDNSIDEEEEVGATIVNKDTPNRMASVIVIGDTSVAEVSLPVREVNTVAAGEGESSSSTDVSTHSADGGFDNAAFVGDEDGKGPISQAMPHSPMAPATPTPPVSAPPEERLESRVRHSSGQQMPPTPRHGESGGVNGLGPTMMDPSSSPATLNVSGLIMATESEKADLESGGAGVAEAVNLELVNMNPYGGGLVVDDMDGKSNNGGLNGIPVKRGDEEMGGEGGFGDPYDEYFVPVNEHRKYIRGEKLYVTKDRRRSQSWKRCACWAVGFTLLAIAILIAILAGTGVILTQEEPQGAVEGRSLGGGGSSSIPRVAESKDHNAPVDRGRTSDVTDPQPELSSSSFTPPPSMMPLPVNPPTTEMSALYVPRVLEAEMSIDSMEYTSDLANHSSSNFKRLARDLEAELKTALFDYHTMMNGPAELFIKVIDFRPGSVVAKFHVGWRFKDSFPSPQDPIDTESLQDRLEAHLLKNGGYLYTYHVSSGSVMANHLMDICQIDNGGCSHECRYDYQEALFACNCPPGLYLDQNEKKCSRDLVENSVPSTEGPKFDEGPWMPMMPKEEEPETITEQVVKLLENSPEEVEHHHKDTVYHVHGMANGDDSSNHSHETTTPVSPISTLGEEETTDRHEVVAEVVPTPSEEEQPHNVDHNVESNEPSSVGTGRSSGEDEVSVWMHSPVEEDEEVGHEEEEADDGLVHTSMEGVHDHSIPGHPGLDYPSSEDETWEEMHGADKDPETFGSTEMGAEVSSESSMSKETHGHNFFLTGDVSSTESQVNGSEHSDEYDAHVVDVHPADLNDALNGTGDESKDHSPVNGQIVSAVEHVVVKGGDEEEVGMTTEGMGKVETESDSGQPSVFTIQEGVLGGESGHEESKEMTNSEEGKQGDGLSEVMIIGRDGEEGKDSTIIDKESDEEGAKQEDTGITTVQDVNYVIDHEEPSKDKKVVVMSVGEEADKKAEDEEPSIAVVEEGVHLGESVGQGVENHGMDEGTNSQEHDTSKQSKEEGIVPVMAVVGDGLEEGTTKVEAEIVNAEEGASVGEQHQLESPAEVNGGEEDHSSSLHVAVMGEDSEERDATTALPMDAAVFVSTKNMTEERGPSEGIESVTVKEEEGSLVGRLGEVPLSKDEPRNSERGTVTENGVVDGDWEGRFASSNETAGQHDIVALNPEEHLTSEDEDPNIVPVEEIPKETLGDHVDVKKLVVVPEIDVRLGNSKDLDEDKSTMEVTTKGEDIALEMKKSMATSEKPDGEVEKMIVHEIQMLNVTQSSTSSPLENSIENLSDQYNSSYEVSHFLPSAENDLSAISSHFLVPISANNKSSESTTTPSSRDNENNDVNHGSQLQFPQTVSSQPSSTEANTKAAEEGDSSLLMSAVNDSMSPLGLEKQQSTSNEMAAQDDELSELIKDTAAKLEAEIRMQSVPHVTPSPEPNSITEDAEQAEKKIVSEGNVMVADTTTEMGTGEEATVAVEKVEKSLMMERDNVQPDVKEESSLSTQPQDVTIENANTVHAVNPTSPSSVFEETSKDHASDSTLVTLGHTDDATESSKDASALNHGLSLESDDNEQENNLASLDAGDSVRVSEEKDPLTRDGVIDAGLKVTTEHTNEIVLASVGHDNWPITALGANNVTKGEATVEEGYKPEGNLGSHVKPDTYEIPVKKKGEFKKPTHHEDEITKPLLYTKEGKENSNKLDKVGLLPLTPVVTTEGPTTIQMDDGMNSSSPATTEEVPSAAEVSSEASMMPVLPIIEKGGERLNVIAEDDSGNRKDLGKPIVKETSRKDLGEGITSEPEISGEVSEMPKEVVSEDMKDGQRGKNLEAEVMMVNKEGILAEGEDAVAKETVEDSKSGEDAVEVTERPAEVHPVVKETGDEHVTTVGPDGETKVPNMKDVNDRMDKGMGASHVTTPSSEDNSTDGTTMTDESVEATTALVPNELEAHKNMEEMLKEMGGFGEGGHRVVAKTGVESLQPSVKVEGEAEGTTMKEMDETDHPSTFSVPVVSSTTSLPSSTSEEVVVTTTEEPIQTSTMPLDSETMKAEVEMDIMKVENSSHEPDSLSNDAPSEGPVPTLMVHEIVTTHPSPSVPKELPKDSDMMTAVPHNGGAPEMSTVIPEENPPTTLPDPETMVREETSSIADPKVNITSELANKNVDDTASKILPDGAKEENHIEGSDSEVPNSPIIPELDEQHFAKCTAGQFQCINGTSLTPYSVIPISSSSVASLTSGVACVPLSAKCDSVNDCSDGSDEVGCIDDGCPGNFQCSNGQCLKRHLVCNGIVDCNDGSDEGSCDTWQCQFDEFQCPSGRCIPSLWQCDGKPDCDNHTDEHNCQDSCGNDEYLCPERWCIPMSWRCNGVPECANGEDEKLCDCSLEQVKCGTGGCVARSEVCDGVDQCPDRSDEWGCTRLHNETMKLEVRTYDDEWLPVCADQWDNKWSNFICQSFGYSRAVFTEYPTSGGLSESSEIFMLKPGVLSDSSPLRNGMGLPGMLEKVSSSLCVSGSIVAISCQEFTCGNHGVADVVAARLAGGDEAANGQWPSVALLYHTRQRATCTASIISPRWLIASYNCLHVREKSLSPDGWVTFGGGSTFDKDKPETQIKTVKSIVPYPQVKYNRFLYNHDVALVELAEPLTFTQSVGAICLPEKPIEPRQLCVTAGWGYTSPGEMNFSQYLHYLPVPTIDLNECNSTKHYSGFITEDKICAGFTDAMHSPCYNDEGAPLMCVSEGGIWELQGVLSYHSNCGRGFHPSIFSSVTSVREWVRRVVGGHFERRSAFSVRRRRRRRLSPSPVAIWT